MHSVCVMNSSVATAFAAATAAVTAAVDLCSTQLSLMDHIIW